MSWKKGENPPRAVPCINMVIETKVVSLIGSVNFFGFDPVQSRTTVVSGDLDDDHDVFFVSPVYTNFQG
jgi:hypothetical protein